MPGSGLTKWIPFGINRNQSRVFYFLKGDYREDGRPLLYGDLVDTMGTIDDVFGQSAEDIQPEDILQSFAAPVTPPGPSHNNCTASN